MTGCARRTDPPSPAALTETEKYVQARMGGNAPAENTGKWIAATFEHDTARPVDGYPAPHLHTHVVVFNMTEDARGQARSLQPYELFKIQSMATAVYQNQLEYELRQAGYKIERGLNHAPEIKGYSREYLESESLRNAEIQRELKERGLSGAEAINNIKHQNREAKLNLTPDELKAMHKEQCSRVWRPARTGCGGSRAAARTRAKRRTLSGESASGGHVCSRPIGRA